MKARVIATGFIIDVHYSHTFQDVSWFLDAKGCLYANNELEILDTEDNIDYWSRLKHQAAISAVQGIMSNAETFTRLLSTTDCDETLNNFIANKAINIANALVSKLKNI